MDPKILMQINEIYRNEVYSEETLSESELADITGWVSSLISEGYNLDDYSDEELYAAYLEDLDEAYRQPKPIRLMRQLGNIRSDSERFKARANEPGMSKNQKDAFKNVSKKLETRGDRMEKVWSKHDPEKVKAREKMNKSTITVTPIRPRLPESYELDLYDIVSEYLVSEGFCDSYEDADVIMANMSEEWRESVLDEVTGRGYIEPVTGRHTGSHPAVRTQKPGSPAMGLMGRNPYDKNRTKAKYVQSLPSTPENQRRLRNLNKGERVMRDRYRTTQNAAHDARHKEKYGQ
jgi:hypothetical protein